MAKYKQSDYEVLRRRCVELHQQGWKQSPIAQALGLTQGWVSQTLKKYLEQRPAALSWRKPTGAPTRLTTDQLGQLVEALNKGAEHHGFAGAVWTRPRINEVIKKLFNVSYDPSQVGRLLKKVGWTGAPERPSKTTGQSPSAERISGGPIASGSVTRTQKKPKLKAELFYMLMNPPVTCFPY